jgi:hypothetical protein
MNERHKPRLPSRPPFVERTLFDERNNVLFLLLGIVAVAERVMSVVPELVDERGHYQPGGSQEAEQTARLLR